jgi:hypothetical protein
MEESYIKVTSDPENLLAPGRLIPMQGLGPPVGKA